MSMKKKILRQAMMAKRLLCVVLIQLMPCAALLANAGEAHGEHFEATDRHGFNFTGPSHVTVDKRYAASANAEEKSLENAAMADVTVTGTVVDGNGEPLPGVTVSVQGTTTGTATDIDGRYSLVAPEGSILVFSFIGFVTQPVALGGKTVIDVVLVEDISSLDEVIVVGYGVQKKANMTGSVASINLESLENKSRPVTNVSQILNNAVPGL